MKFKDLALGARFRYWNYSQTWIKLSNDGLGLIAEYDPKYIRHSGWVGQRICSFAETQAQLEELEVVLKESELPDSPPLLSNIDYDKLSRPKICESPEFLSDFLS
jgi:hypothetical protein